MHIKDNMYIKTCSVQLLSLHGHKQVFVVTYINNYFNNNMPMFHVPVTYLNSNLTVPIRETHPQTT